MSFTDINHFSISLSFSYWNITARSYRNRQFSVLAFSDCVYVAHKLSTVLVSDAAAQTESPRSLITAAAPLIDGKESEAQCEVQRNGTDMKSTMISEIERSETAKADAVSMKLTCSERSLERCSSATNAAAAAAAAAADDDDDDDDNHDDEQKICSSGAVMSAEPWRSRTDEFTDNNNDILVCFS